MRGVDKLFLSEIYAASEKPIPGINSASLAHGIRQICPNLSVATCNTNDEIIEKLCGEVREGDIVITQGAGNITALAPKILEFLGK